MPQSAIYFIEKTIKYNFHILRLREFILLKLMHNTKKYLLEGSHIYCHVLNLCSGQLDEEEDEGGEGGPGAEHRPGTQNHLDR